MNVKFANVAELRDSIVSRVDPAYRKRMYQPVPNMPTVKNRGAYLVEKSKGKVVLDIGCTGIISASVKQAAKAYYGLDKEAGDCIEAVNLDKDELPLHDDVEVVLCSEVLEHLSNPGSFLDRLKLAYPGRSIYVTAPNAGAYQYAENCEVVNSEHVCWYSYATLKALLTRHGFVIKESRWCNGDPFKAEGIIMVTEA